MSEAELIACSRPLRVRTRTHEEGGQGRRRARTGRRPRDHQEARRATEDQLRGRCRGREAEQRIEAQRAGLRPCDALLTQAKGDAGREAALVTAALVRALAHGGTTPAVRQLVKVAGDHNGAFRPEITRQLRALGDKSLPALIETRKARRPSCGTGPTTSSRRWESVSLATPYRRRTTRSSPTSSMRTAPSTISTPCRYSLLRELGPRAVRTAARESLTSFGQDAVWKLREAYANLTGKAAPEGWPAADVAKELFAAYDRVRLQEVYGLLEDGLKKEKDGKTRRSRRRLRQGPRPSAVARPPRGMVPAYVAQAEKLEEGDAPAALAMLRKAARIAPDGPRISQVKAEIAYLEGKDLVARGSRTPSRSSGRSRSTRRT